MWTGRHTKVRAEMFTAPDAVARLRAAQQHARENPLLGALARQLSEAPLELRR